MIEKSDRQADFTEVAEAERERLPENTPAEEETEQAKTFEIGLEEAETVRSLETGLEEAGTQGYSLQSSSTVAFVQDARDKLEQLEEFRREKNRLNSELKQCDKAVTAMERSISDSIGVALKRKKEEVVAGFDAELMTQQEALKRLQAERTKARADAMHEKIQRDTAGFNQENQELEEQTKLLFQERGVPRLCKSHYVGVLFFPKTWKDWLLDAAVFVVLLFFIPYLAAGVMTMHPFGLSVLFFVYAALLFLAYQWVFRRYMLKFRDTHEAVEKLRAQILDNNRKKNAITNAIKKGQDDSAYGLESYDAQISDMEKQIRETIIKRQEAIDYFESVTRQEITDEITTANREQLHELKNEAVTKREEAERKSNDVAALEKELEEVYQVRLGKDLMNKGKLSGLQSYCESNPTLPIDQAVSCYKSIKK